MVMPMGSSIEDILAQMENAPQNCRFQDVVKVAKKYFGEPRKDGGSHVVFKTPWLGDPRVNLQDDHGKAKRYQVVQLLKAIQRLDSMREEEG